MAHVDLKHGTQHYGETWTTWYEITRDDGNSVLAHVEGSTTAHHAAEEAKNLESVQAQDDEGCELALRLVELAEPGRGSAMLTISFEPPLRSKGAIGSSARRTTSLEAARWRGRGAAAVELRTPPAALRVPLEFVCGK